MKKQEKYIMGITFIVVSLISCNTSDKNESKTVAVITDPIEEKIETKIEAVEVTAKSLFASNGCVACHQPNTKVVGPSLKKIEAAYQGNEAGLISFFKGEGDAIIDLDQVAIMKPFIAITKEMTDDERKDIVNYILGGNY